MVKVVTEHTVKSGGKYHPPGTELDLKGEDLERALEAGAVRRITPEDRKDAVDDQHGQGGDSGDGEQ